MESTKIQSQKTSRIINQNATISLRYSYNRFSKESKSSRKIGNLQYRAGLNTFLHSKVLLYGRSDLQHQKFTIYQARIEITDKAKKYLLQIGRMFPSNISGIGATDGLLFSSKIKTDYRMGFLVGFQPSYQSLDWDNNVRKIGGFLKGKYKKKLFKLQSLMSVVGQYTQGETDREFCYIKVTGDVLKKLDFSFYRTWDIYQSKIPSGRSNVEPTSSQFSFRISLLKSLTLTTRYTTRRQILYAISENSLPDSLLVDELRTGWYNSLRFSHDSIGSFILGYNRRAQSNSDIASTYIFLNYFSKPIYELVSLQVSSSYIHNIIITGFRTRFGANISTNQFGTFYSEVELYSFGYGNFYNDYLQHSIKLNHSWSLWKSYYGFTSIDYRQDSDYTILAVHLGLTYKF